MAGTKELKHKLATIQSIRKVTKTMEMLARSRMNTKVREVKQSKIATFDALRILSRIVAIPDLIHPFLQGKSTAEKTIVIAIGGERGLCGAYHIRLEELLGSYDTRSTVGVAVGKKIRQSMERLHIPLPQQLNEDIDVERIASYISDAVVQEYMDHHRENSHIQVDLVFNTFESIFSYTPTRIQLLPLSAELLTTQTKNLNHEKGQTISITCEPSPSAIIETLVPQLITSIISHGIREAQASEESARMIAMKNATDNADRISEDVRRAYNTARQHGITTELTEIINGAESISQ